MNMTDRAIELIIIEPSFNTAEEHVSALRNAGMAIHPTRMDNAADISAALDSIIPDLILCTADLKRTEFENDLDLCLRSHPDASVIVLYKEQDPEILLQALRSGARDVVSKNDPEHLQFVVKREFGDLLVRRELEQAQMRLQESEERCSALIGNSRDAIAYIHEGMHVRANHVYQEMFGYTDQEELLGIPILDMIAPEDLSKFKKSLRSVESGQGKLDIKCQRNDGGTFDAVLESSPSTVDGEPCAEIIIRNSSAAVRLEQQPQLVSNPDGQKRLPGKQSFLQKLEGTFAEHRSNGTPLALFYISIDDFHTLSRAIGIHASDALMQELSKVLSETVDDDDLLAQFGDQGFVLLSKSTREQAVALSAEIHNAVKEHMFDSSSGLEEPRCNIGITCLSDSLSSCEQLINSAYYACALTRSEDADGTRFDISDELETDTETRQGESQVNALVKEALEAGRFKIVYQPIVSLDGESREIYSVFTRLLDANDKEILPSSFMDAAAQEDSMAAIDRWAIEHALEELASQRAEGRKVVFFLSLSLQTLQDKDFLVWLCDSLREKRVKGSWLTFQMKEADLRNRLTEARTLIEGLKKINCQIAMDQYGVLPKSEVLRKHLPIDFIKFDSSLVEGIAGNPGMQKKLTEMNQEVKLENIKSIITGVEDANSLAVLWTVGVNYIQGYFLQEPSENIEFEFTGTHFS